MPVPIKKFKIIFYSVDATGHLHSTIGMAQALQKRGHDIIFLTNDVLVPKVSSFDLQAIALRCNIDQIKKSDNPAKDYAKIFKNNGFLSGLSSIKKLKMWWETDEKSLLHDCVLQTVDYHPQIEAAIENEKPDCIIMDHVFYLPAISKYGIPWIAIMSVAPTFLYDHPELPPALSGYSDANRADWDEFRAELNKVSNSYDACQQKINKHFNFVPNGQYYRNIFYNVSPFLNIYQYPKELDYTEFQPSVPNLINVEAFMRIEMNEFEIPEHVRPNRDNGQRLIFLSMGSMGSFDMDLMVKLTTSLSKMAHKFIVSKGPLGSKYSLPDNMWGDNFLPQTKILPLVDLVITHGGNNSVTEAFSCGKPMLVLPLFADQYDNAQRVTDKGFGLRLEPYQYKDDELYSAINKLLFDDDLSKRLQAASERIRNSNSKVKACEKIEKMLLELAAK